MAMNRRNHMSDEIQEAVASAKKAQANAVTKLDSEIEGAMGALPDRIKCMKSIDLAHELESLAVMIRARHYLRLSVGE